MGKSSGRGGSIIKKIDRPASKKIKITSRGGLIGVLNKMGAFAKLEPLKLSRVEGRIAGRTTTKVYKANDFMELMNNGTRGSYYPAKNIVVMYKAGLKNRATRKAGLYHEVGHARDYRVTKLAKAYKSIPKAEKESLWVARYNRYQPKSTKVKSFTQVKKALGKGSYYKYFTSKVETVAEAHQYFVNHAKKARKVLPKTYAIYNSTRTLKGGR